MPKSKITKWAKYNEKFADQAKIVCRDDGYTDAKLAKLFGVNRKTINFWQKDYPEFKAAVQDGKDEYDTKKVEKALKKSAIGQRMTEVTQELATQKLAAEIFRLCNNGGSEEKVSELLKNIPNDLYIITKKITKYIPPNPISGIYWTTNRDAERWKHMQKYQVSHEIDEKLLNLILGALPNQYAIAVKAAIQKALPEKK